MNFIFPTVLINRFCMEHALGKRDCLLYLPVYFYKRTSNLDVTSKHNFFC